MRRHSALGTERGKNCEEEDTSNLTCRGLPVVYMYEYGSISERLRVKIITQTIRCVQATLGVPATYRSVSERLFVDLSFSLSLYIYTYREKVKADAEAQGADADSFWTDFYPFLAHLWTHSRLISTHFFD